MMVGLSKTILFGKKQHFSKKNIWRLRKAQEKAIAMLARNPLLGQGWSRQPE